MIAFLEASRAGKGGQQFILRFQLQLADAHDLGAEHFHILREGLLDIERQYPI